MNLALETLISDIDPRPVLSAKHSQVGALQALSTAVAFTPGETIYSACGTSAGAVTATFVAAGVPISNMAGALLSMRRQHIWDPCFFQVCIGKKCAS